MARHKLQIPPPFEEILERYEREIMRYLLHVLGNSQDAADLFQETWLRAYRAYPRLAFGSSVRPWLYAIASNLCRNRARDSARRHRVLISDHEELSDANARRHHRLDDDGEGYAIVRMRELISDLPKKQQQALHLRYFAGFKYDAIALAMGCSEEGARANVSQAMKKLKASW
jgi:RNA polymerase sigma-70 factor (ECF subfamily)